LPFVRWIHQAKSRPTTLKLALMDWVKHIETETVSDQFYTQTRRTAARFIDLRWQSDRIGMAALRSLAG